MTVSTKLKIALLTGTLALSGLDVGTELSIPGLPSFVTTAEARVGRPEWRDTRCGAARLAYTTVRCDLTVELLKVRG